MHNNIKKGFTLVELLIVIAIIGIIASIVLVSTSNSNKEAKQAKIISIANSFAKAAATENLADAATFAKWEGAIDYGTGANIDANCNSEFSGNPTAINACIEILKTLGKDVCGGAACNELRTRRGERWDGSAWVTVPDSLSILVRLDGSADYYYANTLGRTTLHKNTDPTLSCSHTDPAASGCPGINCCPGVHRDPGFQNI